MKLSVLLIKDENTSCDVRALLDSKISSATIAKSHVGDVSSLSGYDLIVVQDENSIPNLPNEGAEVIVWDDFCDLSEKVDVFLQLKRHLFQYPLSLEDWVLTEVLHNSDNAVIYRAVNKDKSKVNKEVAIKYFKFKPSSLTTSQIKAFIDKFNSRSHPNSSGLVRFYDGGVTDTAFYVIMEYLEYGTLRQALNGCGKILPLPHALQWFQEIVLALDCVHHKGLIHRDLKIDNVMLREDGSLALVNYGLSKRIMLDAGFVNEGALYCSPHYVSPEQITGESCTHQSDFYSLGVIFYELLTGSKPYAGNEAHELMMQHVMAPIPVLPNELSSFQPMLDKLMAKNPEDRYSSAIEAIESLPMVA